MLIEQAAINEAKERELEQKHLLVQEWLDNKAHKEKEIKAKQY